MTVPTVTAEGTLVLDLDAIRARFPALGATGPDGRPLVRADAPGGTQAVDTAIEAMAGHLRTGTTNQHGPFAGSRQLDEALAGARADVGRFLGSEPEGVVFGANMTTLTWHFTHALTETLGPEDEIVCTRLDHDANVAPWLALAQRTGATVRWVPLDPEEGRLATDSLDQVVTDRARWVAMPAASNALGTLTDTQPLVAAAHSVGARTFLDAVHAVPHVPVHRHARDIDVLVCSPYKFFGPHCGLLVADPGLLGELSPDKVRPAPDQGPERWQTGTAAFEAIEGMAAAVRYLEEIGMDAIREHECGLAVRFLAGIADLGHVALHGPSTADGRTPTFTVTIDGMTPWDAAQRLGQAGVDVTAGHYYAIEPMKALGLLDQGGGVRVGFVHYHGFDDVDRVLEGLADLA